MNRQPSKSDGPLHQPKDGPTIFDVAERTFGRKFSSDTQLWTFVNAKKRDLELNNALLAAGWKCQRKVKRKILLRTADRLFDGFISRLSESNRNTRFAYFVQEVILFGSFLHREERVTDIDLCISYCRKTRAMVERKIRRIMRDHHVGKTEGYSLSLQEISDFLTAKNPRFHSSDSGTIKRLGVPYKLIYCIPRVKTFVRLIEETEDQVDVTHLHESIQKRLDGLNSRNLLRRNRPVAKLKGSKSEPYV